MTSTRRHFVQALGSAAALGVLHPLSAFAQALDQVKIMYGFPAGSAGDSVARRVAEKLEGTLVSLMAAARADAQNADAQALLPFAHLLEGAAQWSVVLLLTWNPAARDFGRLAMRLRDKLRQRLAAYNVQCFVLNESESAPHQPWTLTRVEP